MSDTFADRLIEWQAHSGRHNLPWQQNRSPYRVWLSEIMLQQTQATTVADYFQRFTQRFPDVAALADASLDEVLHLWTGLGYYARARNLHRAAIEVRDRFQGQFPSTQTELESLPGIGRSTAAAIRALAFGQSATILDGNVKRVLARHHAIGDDLTKSAPLKALWTLAETLTPAVDADTYTQAIMDLGATVCRHKQPQCEACPVQRSCAGYAEGDPSRYPTKRKAAKKPVRASFLFLLTDPTGACLLERQPPDGLWGGLWSPPLRPHAEDVGQLCDDAGIDRHNLQPVEDVPSFRHTFTHFHLDITPRCFTVLDAAPLAIEENSNYLWHSSRNNLSYGLTAPAVKLLKAIDKSTRNE